MNRTPRVEIFLLTAWLVAGCGDAGPSADLPRSTVRDSAAVRIVENEAPGAATRLPWTIGSTPAVAIGSLDAGESYELFRVGDALRLADGRILVANGGSSEVRVFDGDGMYVESWGQPGQGPGEFVDLTDLVPWPGDSVMAWDSGEYRLTLYDQAGNRGRTMSPELGGDLGAGAAVGVLPGGTVLVAGRLPWAGQDPVTGLVRRSRDYALIDPSGDVQATLGPFPDEEYVIAGPRLAIIRHPFGRFIHTAIWGNRVILTPSDRYEIRAYGPVGQLEMIVRRDHAPVPVAQSALDADLARRIGDADPSEQGALRDLFDGFPRVPTFPAFSEVLVDATGDLWVKEYGVPGDERSVWSVFDSKGRVRGFVETPPGLHIYQIGSDFLLGLTLGDLDVEQVQLWSLSRGSDTSPDLR